MPLFHPRVIKKHINKMPPMDINHVRVLKAWAQNLEKGIYDSETQNDGEFIQQILINVLGYVGSSEGQNWSVAKNQPINHLNVDVALGEFSADNVKIIAPFELKGAKTKDLDAIMAGRGKSPVQQAWEYANEIHGGTCQWVIVSNYREIRLYAFGYGKKNYESFDLSDLSAPENYKRFILLLSAKNLLSGKTLGFLKESEQVDKDITNQLYADYKTLRVNLIKTLGKDNPKKNPLDIIKYTQTILDRVLFVAFAEDKGLLPKNTLQNAYEAKNNFNPQPIWDNFKGLFHAIDKGNSTLQIPHYNGGLFAEDKELDSLSISDELCEGFKKIGGYDFESDVSVNILGHIFEQSISDLEELKAHANNVDVIDPKKSKRKKDGIFYTPSYITRYIVEQAVGGWLNDRRQELGFDKLPELKDEDYASIQVVDKGRGKNKVTEIKSNNSIKKHIEFWEAYKEKLSNIKVLDPACGSGAFLNEVFDYLKAEGETVNGELAILKGEQTALFRWDTHILANNIYGVDLNNESVEITKLSLWLKTANKQEKLTYLENNIKCGNSLIDDPAVAGDSAFDWNKEFSDIMDNGGFDVIIANPPYVFARDNFEQIEKNYYVQKYKSAQYQVNTYLLFIEKSINLIKEKSGRCNLIVPNAWLMVSSAEQLRQFILEKTSIQRITNLQGYSFENVNVETIIVDLIKIKSNKDHNLQVFESHKSEDFKFSHLKKQSVFFKNNGFEFQIFITTIQENLIQKIARKTKRLDDIYDVKAGLQAYEANKGNPKQTEQDVKNRIYDFNIKINDQTYKYLDGKDVCRYYVDWKGLYLEYGEHLAAPRELKIFSSPVIIVREITGKYPKCMVSTYSEGKEILLFNRSNIAVLSRSKGYDLKFLLGILNSCLMSYYFMKVTPKSVRQMFPKIILKDLREFPIKITSPDVQKPLIDKVTIALEINKILLDSSEKFVKLFQSEFHVEKISSRLENWYELEFSEFVNEIEKSIKPKKLSLSQKAEWMPHFETEKGKAVALKNQIDQTDKEIDQMVYILYDLTPEEIDLIENAY